MSLRVVRPGLFSTVQDSGRPGHRAFGVASGGVFDRGSAGLANALLGNPESAAVVEMTLVGGHFEALAPVALALAGAPFVATVQSRDGPSTTLAIPSCFPLGAGDQLRLGGTARGARGYLAVRGGWQTPVVLGSRSSETPLQAGEILACAAGMTPIRHPSQALDPFDASGTLCLRLLEGPDAELLIGRRFDRSSLYRVGPQCDRIGLRLEGPRCDVDEPASRDSAPIAPGAVQVAGGVLMVLGVACGTMGGYPHVAQLISADLDRLAQIRPGDAVSFEWVTLVEARRLDCEASQRRATRRARVATAALD